MGLLNSIFYRGYRPLSQQLFFTDIRHPLTATRYIMYFRFCGWRQISV